MTLRTYTRRARPSIPVQNSSPISEPTNEETSRSEMRRRMLKRARHSFEQSAELSQSFKRNKPTPATRIHDSLKSNKSSLRAPFGRRSLSNLKTPANTVDPNSSKLPPPTGRLSPVPAPKTRSRSQKENIGKTHNKKRSSSKFPKRSLASPFTSQPNSTAPSPKSQVYAPLRECTTRDSNIPVSASTNNSPNVSPRTLLRRPSAPQMRQHSSGANSDFFLPSRSRVSLFHSNQPNSVENKNEEEESRRAQLLSHPSFDRPPSQLDFASGFEPPRESTPNAQRKLPSLFSYGSDSIFSRDPSSRFDLSPPTHKDFLLPVRFSESPSVGRFNVPVNRSSLSFETPPPSPRQGKLVPPPSPRVTRREHREKSRANAEGLGSLLSSLNLGGIGDADEEDGDGTRVGLVQQRTRSLDEESCAPRSRARRGTIRASDFPGTANVCTDETRNKLVPRRTRSGTVIGPPAFVKPPTAARGIDERWEDAGMAGDESESDDPLLLRPGDSTNSSRTLVARSSHSGKKKVGILEVPEEDELLLVKGRGV